jgi:hypothetical protein
MVPSRFLESARYGRGVLSVPRLVPSFVVVAREHYPWDWLLQIKLRRFDPGSGHHHHYTPLHIPIVGLTLQLAI